MMIKFNRKGLINIVTFLLMLFLTVSAGIGIYDWFIQLEKDMEAKMNLNKETENLEIFGVKSDTLDQFFIVIRNTDDLYYIINSVLVNGNECLILNNNVVETVTRIDLNCSLNTNSIYDLDLFTDKGILSKKVKLKN